MTLILSFLLFALGCEALVLLGNLVELLSRTSRNSHFEIIHALDLEDPLTKVSLLQLLDARKRDLSRDPPWCLRRRSPTIIQSLLNAFGREPWTHNLVFPLVEVLRSSVLFRYFTAHAYEPGVIVLDGEELESQEKVRPFLLNLRNRPELCGNELTGRAAAAYCPFWSAVFNSGIKNRLSSLVSQREAHMRLLGTLIDPLEFPASYYQPLLFDSDHVAANVAKLVCPSQKTAMEKFLVYKEIRVWIVGLGLPLNMELFWISLLLAAIMERKTPIPPASVAGEIIYLMNRDPNFEYLCPWMMKIISGSSWSLLPHVTDRTFLKRLQTWPEVICDYRLYWISDTLIDCWKGSINYGRGCQNFIPFDQISLQGFIDWFSDYEDIVDALSRPLVLSNLSLELDRLDGSTVLCRTVPHLLIGISEMLYFESDIVYRIEGSPKYFEQQIDIKMAKFLARFMLTNLIRRGTLGLIPESDEPHFPLETIIKNQSGLYRLFVESKVFDYFDLFQICNAKEVLITRLPPRRWSSPRQLAYLAMRSSKYNYQKHLGILIMCALVATSLDNLSSMMGLGRNS